MLPSTVKWVLFSWQGAFVGKIKKKVWHDFSLSFLDDVARA